jgi:hypothetical protein
MLANSDYREQVAESFLEEVVATGFRVIIPEYLMSKTNCIKSVMLATIPGRLFHFFFGFHF